MFYTYLLRCEDHSLYAGITTDPARRFASIAVSCPAAQNTPPCTAPCAWKPLGAVLTARLHPDWNTSSST